MSSSSLTPSLQTPPRPTGSLFDAENFEAIVRRISESQKEPTWMLELRLESLAILRKLSLPNWGPDLSGLDLEKILYQTDPLMPETAHSWKDVPDRYRKIFDELGLPEAEKDFLAGTGTQVDGTTMYHALKESMEAQGVIFLDLPTALLKHEDIVRKYFMKNITARDHFFSALHGAFWKGGSFLFIPKDLRTKDPFQSYFRMETRSSGQFEHTLIILEDGSDAHYIEGCSAPRYETASLHAGAVEIFIGDNAKLRYSSVENWSENTYNLNTKRAILGEKSHIDWVGGNLGAGVTMLYPCSVLRGVGSSATHIGLAFAKEWQVIDTGAKIIHLGAHTNATVISKSVSHGNGKNIYRGLIEIAPGALDACARVECDGILVGGCAKNESLPTIRNSEPSATVSYEASAGRIDEHALTYLRHRGLAPSEAEELLVRWFLDPIIRELPFEFAAEMNVLIRDLLR